MRTDTELLDVLQEALSNRRHSLWAYQHDIQIGDLVVTVPAGFADLRQALQASIERRTVQRVTQKLAGD